MKFKAINKERIILAQNMKYVQKKIMKRNVLNTGMAVKKYRLLFDFYAVLLFIFL